MSSHIVRLARKFTSAKAVVGTVLLGLAVSTAHAVPPTTIDGVADLGVGYIDKGTLAAVAAGILGFGWIGYRIVKKYTGKA